ncbi:ATP-binding cassette domain-containing protein [Streptomyces sp. RKND-216]|nr:ATP-binding cassette domain-containing protein [Streptomyces sp. RKND-216]
MTAPPDDDVLWARGLTYAYDGSPALQDVTLGIRTGEIVAVTGPRGSGKSTLLSCLSGRLLPDGGEVWFQDVPVHTLGLHSRERLRRERFGWIGSEPQLVPELNAWENAALPLLLAGVGSRAARRAAHEWLERLDIGDCARKRPTALLQAQRQRVAIARSLVHSPTVLFADEPTAPLHQADRVQALRTLTTAARTHGITVVLSSHGPVPTADTPSPVPAPVVVPVPAVAGDEGTAGDEDGDDVPAGPVGPADAYASAYGGTASPIGPGDAQTAPASSVPAIAGSAVTAARNDLIGSRIVDRAIALLDGRCVQGAAPRETEGSTACSLSV